MKLELFFDGACEPRNPGGVATFGFVLTGLDGHGTVTGSGVAAEGDGATNNVAEYEALLAGLRWLGRLKWPFTPKDVLVIRGDSKLVVEQIEGRWACRSEVLLALKARALAELAGLTVAWRTEWVPREENAAADALSQAAYVRHTGRPFPVRTNAHLRGKR